MTKVVMRMRHNVTFYVHYLFIYLFIYFLLPLYTRPYNIAVTLVLGERVGFVT
jgi:hypothetical protein